MTDQAFTTSNLSTDMPELCIDDFQHSTIGDLKTEIALMTTRLKEWEETERSARADWELFANTASAESGSTNDATLTDISSAETRCGRAKSNLNAAVAIVDRLRGQIKLAQQVLEKKEKEATEAARTAASS
jgi:hypothetical protein